MDAVVDDFLLDMLQEDKITQRQYQHITGRRFDNIARILPRSEVRTLLLMKREIDRVHGKAPDAPAPPAA